MQLFPEAEIKLNLKAEDAFYGLKAVGVELKGAQKSALNTYDFWSRNLLDKNGKLSPAVNNEALDYVVKLKDYKNTLGGVLKAGDKFSLRFVANDHDDVLPLKLKGASDWLEIQVVDRNAIELVLEKAQEKARQELLRAREGQKKATKNAEFALKEIKSGEANLQKSLEAVASAEIEQKNVLEKLGEKDSGLLGDLDKIKSLAEANKLKASASLNRLNDLAKEIKQLKDGAGALVEQNLSDASKRLESADSGKELDKEKLAKSLDNSIKNQNEIEKMLDGLLKNLEPWAGLTEMRSDARAALLELEEVKRKLEESTKLDPSSIGKKLDELSNQQKEKLQNLSNQQIKAAQKAQTLLDKMNQLAGDNKKQDEALAKNINDALELPDVKQLNENLNAAKKETDANRLIEASKLQSKAVDAVKEILEKLEENPGEVNQKLVKKLREAEKQLQELKDEMQRLKKKRIEAQMIKDAEQKKAALAKNSSDTEKLASKMEEMAQNLRRIKNENNSENLDDSARELRRATANPMADDDGKAFQQAMEKLQREIQDVQQLARETEEKLQRERLEKVAENLKLIQDRQVALILESERFDLLLKDKGAWTRAQILSLTGFSRAQIGLADETELVASRELDNLPVFMKTIGMAGRSMRNAAKLAERNARTQTKGPPLIEKVIPAQKEALVRLQQFQEALKEEMSQIGAVAKDNNPENKDKDSEGQTPEQSSSAGGPPDRKPASIAQLKLLRNLQSELYERTGAIASRFPEAKGMPEEARRELLQLQKDQREIGELLELLLEFNRQSQPKGEMQ